MLTAGKSEYTKKDLKVGFNLNFSLINNRKMSVIILNTFFTYPSIFLGKIPRSQYVIINILKPLGTYYCSAPGSFSLKTLLNYRPRKECKESGVSTCC